MSWEQIIAVGAVAILAVTVVLVALYARHERRKAVAARGETTRREVAGLKAEALRRAEELSDVEALDEWRRRFGK